MPAKNIRNRCDFVDVKRRQSEGIIRQSEGIIRRNRSDSSLSSLDSLASPTHGSTKKTAEKSTNVDAVEQEILKSHIG